MRSRSITLIWLIALSLAACQVRQPERSPSLIATSDDLTAVASPTLQVETNTQSQPNASTPVIAELAPVRFSTIPEVEDLAGFKVQQPTYLPEGVSFDSATYQKTPNLSVTLYFKIVHPQYGDRGVFFQIMQEPQSQAPPDMTSCSQPGDGVCEILQIGAIPVVYHRYSAGTEGIDWHQSGLSYRLLRTAGEPGKVYKDELVKVVGSVIKSISITG